MKVTVIFEDGVIVKDNEPKFGFEFSQDLNWRVIQWLDNEGWIEVVEGDRVWLETDKLVQPYIEMWNNK